MKKIIKLKESDLIGIIKKIIREQQVQQAQQQTTAAQPQFSVNNGNIIINNVIYKLTASKFFKTFTIYVINLIKNPQGEFEVEYKHPITGSDQKKTISRDSTTQIMNSIGQPEIALKGGITLVKTQ